MIRISGIKISIFDVGSDRNHELNLLKAQGAKRLHCSSSDIRKLMIVRRSVDARDPSSIVYVYTADYKLRDSVAGPNNHTEGEYIRALKDPSVSTAPIKVFDVNAEPVGHSTKHRPVIIGAGPAGLFAALALIENGLNPLIIERGDRVDQRDIKVSRFHETGILDSDSNVRFGEGGAGTYSDGKLSSGIRDPEGIIAYILGTFVRFGADSAILYEQKPHVGTDVLRSIISNIRAYITERGGEYLFNSRFDGFIAESGRINTVYYTDTLTGERRILPADQVLLAIGNAARDTFEALSSSGIYMEPKPFAIGVRVMHPAELIDRAMYGEEDLSEKVRILGHASYKLTYRSKCGRNVYSFCMCPGGYVIDASAEIGMLSVNGMSYNHRDAYTSNAAIVVNVGPENFPEIDETALAGIELQREIESKAYAVGGGRIPYESFDEFAEGAGSPCREVFYEPCLMGLAEMGKLSAALPDFIRDPIIEAFYAFDRRIPGFAGREAIVAGVETGTSSPLRIKRNDQGESVSLKGLYPAGEGAGYAGGIISAARDGILSARRMINNIYERSL